MWEERNDCATPNIPALWLAAAMLLKMLLLSSWQSSAGRYLSHMFTGPPPSYVLPSLSWGVTQEQRSFVFLAFKFQRPTCNARSNFGFLVVEASVPVPAKFKARHKNSRPTQSIWQGKKTFLLGIFNLPQCPFNLNMKSKKRKWHFQFCSFLIRKNVR